VRLRSGGCGAVVHRCPALRDRYNRMMPWAVSAVMRENFVFSSSRAPAGILWSGAPRNKSDIVVSHEKSRALAKMIGISPVGSTN
jgi:hypothetical protein